VAESEDQPTRYVSAFVSQAMRSALEESAREHDRSLSGEIRVALRQYFADPSGVLPSPSGFRLPEGSEESEP
jgi:hypothetical protein